MALASDSFLGDLKAQLSDVVAHRLSIAQGNDWTACEIGELVERLHGLRTRA